MPGIVSCVSGDVNNWMSGIVSWPGVSGVSVLICPLGVFGVQSPRVYAHRNIKIVRDLFQ